MQIITVDPQRPDPESIERAASILRAGGLVVFPTETVYGLGANALDAEAVRRIFAAKGRPSNNPIIVHVADVSVARSLTGPWPSVALRLAEAFWPGPLTLVLPRSGAIPDIVTAGLATVAIRIPRHPVALELLRKSGLPIAAPSANRSMALSPTRAGHAASLSASVDLLLDGGQSDVGIESAVVDVSGPVPRLLRPGTIPLVELENVAGTFEIRTGHPDESAAMPSPGMMARHYAPAAKLRVFSTSDREHIEREAGSMLAAGQATGVLLRESSDFPATMIVTMPEEASSYARDLYAALHAFDEAGCDTIFVEAVPEGDEWDGVRDRLERASAK